MSSDRTRTTRFPAALPRAACILALSILALGAGTQTARAGGPLVLFDPSTRTAYAYPGTVNVYTDLGPNGILTNEESDALVAQAVSEWTNVPTSRFAATIAGEILVGGVPTDITLANVDSIVTYTGPERYNGGGIHVIYDSDGSITSGYFGAPPGVAGIASPEFGSDVAPELQESWVVLNGSVIDPTDTSPPGASFAGVYTHEFGHAINLAHTQCNGGIIFFYLNGEDDAPAGCSSLGGTPDPSQTETMYPYLDVTPGSTGEYQATVDLLDDTAALSDIYPAGGWPAGTGTISGTIFLPDSVTQVSGINVIARNLADPLGDCVSAISGDYTQGLLGPDGLYTLTGLTPGAQYVVYIDVLDANAGFSTPQAETIFPEEYWNGASESGDIESDPACDYVAITAVAGGTATADIYLNSAVGGLPLGDDDAVNVALPFGFSFCGTVYNSVWIASNGYVTFGTADALSAPDPASLLGGVPRIAGLWADLDPTAGGAIAAVEADGNFEIQYLSVPEYLFGGLSTFTITLRPDGTHGVQYGTVQPLLGALAGRSPGGGASDPGPTDLTAAAQPLGASEETVYETWGALEFPDLSGVDLEYAACGAQVAVPEPGLVPARAALFQSRPNPFRSGTVIGFDLPQPGPVRLRVFDLRGRLVRTLVDENLAAGSYSLPWSGDDGSARAVAPGIYFYRLETPGFTATRKTLRVG